MVAGGECRKFYAQPKYNRCILFVFYITHFGGQITANDDAFVRNECHNSHMGEDPACLN